MSAPPPRSVLPRFDFGTRRGRNARLGLAPRTPKEKQQKAKNKYFTKLNSDIIKRRNAAREEFYKNNRWLNRYRALEAKARAEPDELEHNLKTSLQHGRVEPILRTRDLEGAPETYWDYPKPGWEGETVGLSGQAIRPQEAYDFELQTHGYKPGEQLKWEDFGYHIEFPGPGQYDREPKVTKGPGDIGFETEYGELSSFRDVRSKKQANKAMKDIETATQRIKKKGEKYKRRVEAGASAAPRQVLRVMPPPPEREKSGT